MQRNTERNNELQMFMFIWNADLVVLINGLKLHQEDNLCDLEVVMVQGDVKKEEEAEQCKFDSWTVHDHHEMYLISAYCGKSN